MKKTKSTPRATPRRCAVSTGSGFRSPEGRNRAEERNAPKLPRVMWADADMTNRREPVAVYNTRAEQRSNRPDLQPIRVMVTRIFRPNTDSATKR